MPPRKSIARRKKPSTQSANVDNQLPVPESSELQPIQTDPPVINIHDDEPVENNDDDPDETVEPDETVTDINSAQEETTTVQADDIKGNDDEEVEEIEETISVQESNVSKSPSKNNDAVAVEDVGNGDIEGPLETVAVNESGEAVTALISCENETPVAVEDESKEDVDDDSEKNDDIAGDNVDNKGDEDASPIDNKIEENIEIYVGKLDKDTVEEDLVNVFQQFGELESTRIVRNPATKKSKGFAFVRFASADQATRALSELKDGVEVRGKLVKISKSQNNRTLFLGNISKTWSKEEVLQQLAQYGIEHIETIRVPDDISYNRKNKAGDKKKTKGFAFLEFSTHSEAAAAFQRLKKPDVVFGRDVSAKVSFEQSVKPSTDEDVHQVNRVHVAGLAKDWNEEKVKEICEKYGEIVKIDLHISSKPKHKDFGFVTFSSPKSAQACVEGINTAGIVGETEIIASIARATKPQKQGLHGGVKVEKKNKVTKLDKEGEVSNKASVPNSASEPSSIKIKGLAKDWNEEKVKEICEKYGEIVKIDLHISSKPKHKYKYFVFVTFSSPKSAQACVEGINAAGIVGETEIIASIAMVHGGVKVEKKNEVVKLDKEGEVSNKASEPKSIKMKGVMNSQQTNINGKDSSKNKIKAGIVKLQQKGLVKKQNSGEVVKGEKQSQPLKKDGESSKAKNKRKASSEKNSIAPPDLRQGGQGNSKKPKKGGEGQNSKTNPKAGNNKRKKGPAYEGREDRDNRNAPGKKPLKKHKGSIHGRERDNYRNPQSDAHVIRGHDDYRNSTRYVDPFAPTYAASTPATYHLSSDSVSTRRRQEMEPHAGYIQPAAKQSQSYSAYIQPAVRQHQPVYLEPASTSQSYSRYLDHPVMTQSHRRYIETPVAPEVQPYRGYRQSEIVQIAHDPYDPGLTRFLLILPAVFKI
ncbi:Nucleotide-binding, alpha-beta plait [Artemisia annua]|uniref:Nucleotide-binding, alpha-beta plait n=1 Tax=Artemisia annua TaxID=35608 RepID=A0A2U1PZC3_ARTAN|nr:Nucleotide-binding, alpha-beta plait [Artemisia annua]